jgi:hypothetical protein
MRKSYQERKEGIETAVRNLGDVLEVIRFGR